MICKLAEIRNARLAILRLFLKNGEFFRKCDSYRDVNWVSFFSVMLVF